MSVERQGFFARWAQRKAEQSSAASNVQSGRAADATPSVPSAGQVGQVNDAPALGQPLHRGGVPVAGTVATSDNSVPAAASGKTAPQPDGTGNAAGHAEQPPPTLDDVAVLKPDSDFSAFVRRDVAPAVKNAAMKKLFADPHFNVMDGLDIYIDDYSIPSPLSEQDLKKMVAAQFVKLVEEDPPPVAEQVAAPPAELPVESPMATPTPSEEPTEQPAAVAHTNAPGEPAAPAAAAPGLADTPATQPLAPPVRPSSTESPLP